MKAVIFDFDGTLANTLPICFSAFQHVFKEFDNRQLSFEEIKGMFGPSETGIIRENLIHINKEDAIEMYYEKYVENHSALVNFNQEIDGMLRYLKESGLKLGIVTGKAKRSLDISLKALKMEGFFDVIITGDDVKRPKPNEEGVIKALSLLGVENHEALFIGDSDADILAGNQANVHTVGVQWLPNPQTLKFEFVPNTTFNKVDHFVRFVNRRSSNEL